MANIKSIGGNPIVLDLDGLTDEVKATFGSASVAAGALTGSNATESTWAQRVTTGDGAATIESIKGNTIVQDGSLLSVNIEGVASSGDGWVSEHTIPCGTYFPNGLRSAGNVRDELTSTQAVTRVGAVDLGALAWSYVGGDTINARFTAQVGRIAKGAGLSCAGLTPTTYSNMYNHTIDNSIATHPNATQVEACATAYTDAATFKAAMSGVMLYYQLSDPTTQAISPALNMTYKVEHGGAESIIVPTGEQSAPPVMSVAYGGTKESIIADALAAIAAPDGPTATTNHAVGSYLTMGGKLYKVTRAIASGEQIVSGTNVTETTVMAELLALAN